tara:strand:- start:105 stop:1196 length:1092 start_codon:yes stop_codon:yes gene_type:complete
MNVIPMNKRLIVSFPFQESTISIEDLDGSLTLDALLKDHGLSARDGSFQFLTDANGRMVNHLKLSDAPAVIHVQRPKNVDQVWVDGTPRRGFAPTIDSEGRQISLLGGQENMFTSVYITKWKVGNKNPVAYCFSPTHPYYKTGDLVYIQVPLNGETVGIYNPVTGKENLMIKLNATQQELDSMRGFWSAWELIGNGTNAKFRRDLTPLPNGFKPLTPRSKKKILRVNVDKMHAIQAEPSIHSGRIQIGKNKFKALICGVDSSNSQKGRVVASSNKTRPNLVNLEGYQYGMTQFVKIPESGRTIKLYNSACNQWVDCTVLIDEAYDINTLRNQWVIVRLKKHNKYKRALKIVALPREFYKKKTN